MKTPDKKTIIPIKQPEIVIRVKKIDRKFGKHELKWKILNAIKENHKTVHQIIDAIGYPLKSDHRKGFHIDYTYTELNYLANTKMPFIIKNKTPSRETTYSLTAKGLEHSLDPFCDARLRKARNDEIIKKEIDKGLNLALMGNPVMYAKLCELAQKLYGGSGIAPQTRIVEVPVPVHNIQSPGISSHAINSPSISKTSDDIKPVFIVTNYQDEHGNRLTMDEMITHKAKSKERLAQIRLRKMIAKDYFDNKKWIYGGFFEKWGGDYKIVILKNNIMDIISSNNPEFKREHVKQTLSGSNGGSLRITRIDKDGIYISGDYLKDKFIRF